nr:hypothetical protein CFP56_54154 [Quercus suber]
MVGLAAITAGFFEVWFYLAYGLAKQLCGIGSPLNLRLGFNLIVAIGLGMRTLAWNCRGAGRAPTVRALKALIREESPDVVFIAESKSKSRRIEKIRLSIGFVDKFYVDLASKSRDHAPVILDTHMDQSVRARPFRFEAMWTRDDSSSGIVEKAWQGMVEGSHCFKLARKIQQTRYELQVWNRN